MIDSVTGSTCIEITYQSAFIKLDAKDLTRLSQGWEVDSNECCLNDKVGNLGTYTLSYLNHLLAANAGKQVQFKLLYSHINNKTIIHVQRGYMLCQ